MHIRPLTSGSKPSLLKRYSSDLSRMLDRGQAELALIRKNELKQLDLLMRNIVQQSFDGILAFDHQGRLKTANTAALHMFGYQGEDMTGVHLAKLFPDLDSYRRIGSAHPSLGGDRLEGWGMRRNGSRFPTEMAIQTTEIGGDLCLIVIVRDITEAKSQERRLKHLALHDALTNLPNRLLLKDRITQALNIAERQGDKVALLLLDLDRFKEVNDTLGHQVGDMLLTDVARRLTTCVRQSDTIARLGGDEFAILLPGASAFDRALEVSERIVESISRPFQLFEGLKIEVGISVGIAAFPDHADSENKLMQCADVAMYAAKRGAGSIEIYDSRTDHNTVRLLTLSGALRQAIEQGQLSFAFQPKLDLRQNRITSIEALARWVHPVQGAIPPGEFVPHAENTGMIQPFTRWSFDAAFAHLALWEKAGHQIDVAVNLSSRSLHDKDLPAMARGLIDRWRIDPGRVTLELTESAVMLDPDGALFNVHRLHELGMRISIDDFGTGYSSLSHLQRLPLDELKIDKSFVVDMVDNEQDLMIVRSTIDLAHNMGMTVVAEGVESEAHMQILRDLGCDLCQGFYLTEPLPIDDLTEWFERCTWSVKTDAAKVKATVSA